LRATVSALLQSSSSSLASSAFLVYLDPEHSTNRARTFLIAQGSAALLGYGSVSFLGTGFLAAGVTMVLTVVLMTTLDAMHPPARSTALSFSLPQELAQDSLNLWIGDAGNCLPCRPAKGWLFAGAESGSAINGQIDSSHPGGGLKILCGFPVVRAKLLPG
jgi:hypothetical protein